MVRLIPGTKGAYRVQLGELEPILRLQKGVHLFEYDAALGGFRIFPIYNVNRPVVNFTAHGQLVNSITGNPFADVEELLQFAEDYMTIGDTGSGGIYELGEFAAVGGTNTLVVPDLATYEPRYIIVISAAGTAQIYYNNTGEVGTTDGFTDNAVDTITLEAGVGNFAAGDRVAVYAKRR